MHAAVTLFALCAAAALPAQFWRAEPPQPAPPFGLEGDLVASDQLGMVGFDELSGQTVLASGGGWLVSPSSVPPRVSAAIAANDSRIVLFGGLDLATGLSTRAVWRFDRGLGDWLSLGTGATGSGPSPRRGAKLAALTASGTLFVMFGGVDAGGLPGDSWVMVDTGGAPFWALQPTPTGLVGRLRHGMARAPNGEVLLFGGERNGALLGDTWRFGTTGWIAHTGPGPAPAADVRLAYDDLRDMTVLLHPSGETWEWNGIRWRLVGAFGAPRARQPALVYARRPLGPGSAAQTVALLAKPGTATMFRFRPSPAMFELTGDATCSAGVGGGLTLDIVDRSLPILGEVLHMRVAGVPASSPLFGVFEFTPPVQPSVPIGCSCSLALSGVGAIAQPIPTVPGPRDWLLPIADDPGLFGVSVSVQGIVLDGANPCLVMTTQSGRIVPGR